MSCLADAVKKSLPGIETYDVASILNDYLVFSTMMQQNFGFDGCKNVSDNYGQALAAVNGSPEKWSKQSDGPALRAIATMKIMEAIGEQNVKVPARSVYDKKIDCNDMGMLKRDLEYVSVAFNYSGKDYKDMWEEQEGVFFFNQMVQYEALNKGEAFATSHGDGEAGKYYASKKLEIARSLESNYWRGKYLSVWMAEGCPGTIREQCPARGDENCKNIGVILGFIHADFPGLPLSDPKVLQTADAIRRAFCNRYGIDKRCLLLGRYPVDCFNGNSKDGQGDRQANPWVLSTHAMAQFYYKLANTVYVDKKIELPKEALSFFELVLSKETYGKLAALANEKGRLVAGDALFVPVLKEIANQGDDMIKAVRDLYPVPKAVEASADWLPEQINAADGSKMSARDLSWSYASLLTALMERMDLEKRLR